MKNFFIHIFILIFTFGLSIFGKSRVKPNKASDNMKSHYSNYSEVERNLTWQHKLYSSVSYSNPYKTVILKVKYTNEDSSIVYNSYGFWDGDSTFIIRSYFPTTGTWKWQTSCSDTNNNGLNNKSGIVNVTEYTGDNMLYKHGELKISSDKKYICYEDNTPFIWMGGTAWGMPMAATYDEWKKYINDRHSKKFNIVQIAPAKSHGWVDFTSYPLNRKGEACFFSDDKWNPKYWQEFDKFVQYANSKDIVVVIVGLSEPVYDKFSNDNAILFSRNFSARMEGYHVILTAAFDTYQTSWNSDYDFIGEKLQTFSRHLISQHTGHAYADAPYNIYVKYFLDKTYLDFSMNHSGHNGGDTEVAYKKARKWNLNLYNLFENKPIVNTEALYSSGPYAKRIKNRERKGTDKDARVIGWLSWLSGSLGYTYGATGIWNFGEVSYDSVIIPLDSAISYISSKQMKYLVDFFNSLQWWKLVPKHNAIISNITDETKKMALAISDDKKFGVAFLPDNNFIKIEMSNFSNDINAFWYNTTNGKFIKAEQKIPNTGEHSFNAPNPGEWALLLKNADSSDVVWAETITAFNNNNTIAITFGQAEAATDTIDVVEGEEQLLTYPGSGTFDARFLLSNQTETLTDFRNNRKDNIRWKIKLQSDSSALPITLKWDKNKLPKGSFIIQDSSDTTVNIDMKLKDSLRLSQNNKYKLEIIYSKKNKTNITLNENWNLISIPLLLEDMNVATLFPDSNITVLQYSGEYSNAEQFENGKGYWIKNKNKNEINLTGNKIYSSVSIDKGWNLIGVYDFNISTQNLNTTPDGIISGKIFGYDNGYFIADTLKVGKAYWIKANRSGELNYFNSNSLNKLNISLPSLSFNIFATDELQDTIKLTFGLDSLATNGLDTNLGEIELPPVPPKGIFDARILLNDSLSGYSDIRYKQSTCYNYILKYQLGENSNGLKLTWNLPKGITFHISDAKSGKIINKNYVSGKDSISISDSTLNKLKLTFCYSDAVLSIANNKKVSDRFKLFQNYPNPFNPTTTITYTIPAQITSSHFGKGRTEEGLVSLIVYDVLGREVATLVNKKQSPGNYQIVFDASNLSSGVYYYQLEYGNYLQTKKMILLR